MIGSEKRHPDCRVVLVEPKSRAGAAHPAAAGAACADTPENRHWVARFDVAQGISVFEQSAEVVGVNRCRLSSACAVPQAWGMGGHPFHDIGCIRKSVVRNRHELTARSCESGSKFDVEGSGGQGFWVIVRRPAESTDYAFTSVARPDLLNEVQIPVLPVVAFQHGARCALLTFGAVVEKPEMRQDLAQVSCAGEEVGWAVDGSVTELCSYAELVKCRGCEVQRGWRIRADRKPPLQHPDVRDLAWIGGRRKESCVSRAVWALHWRAVDPVFCSYRTLTNDSAGDLLGSFEGRATVHICQPAPVLQLGVFGYNSRISLVIEAYQVPVVTLGLLGLLCAHRCVLSAQHRPNGHRLRRARLHRRFRSEPQNCLLDRSHIQVGVVRVSFAVVMPGQRARPRLAMGLIFVGSIFATCAILLPTVIVPHYKQLPSHVLQTATLTAQNATVLDSASLASGLVEPESNVPLRVDVSVKSGPPTDDQSVTLIAAVRTTRTDRAEPVNVISGYVDQVTLDRKSAAPESNPPPLTIHEASGTATKTPRTGYQYTFPLGVDRRDYPIYDSEARMTAPAKYVDDDRVIDGVQLLHFQQRIDETNLHERLGDAASLEMPSRAWGTGSTTDTPVRMSLYYSVVRDLWVEPQTGMIVDHHQKILRQLGNSNGFRVTSLQADLRFSDATVTSNATEASRNVRLLFWGSRGAPVTLSLVGLALLAAGIFLGARARERGK